MVDADRAVIDELAREEGNVRLLQELDGIRMRKAALAAENPDKVWNANDIREAYQKVIPRCWVRFLW